MTIRDEILEFPYIGTITRRLFNEDGSEKEPLVVYEGVMDEHMVTEEEGRQMQTANYIISIPLVKNESGKYIVPRKGDTISISCFDNDFELTVDNSEPSQIGGVSIYAARNAWHDETD